MPVDAPLDRADALVAPAHQRARASIRRACCAWPIASTPRRCRNADLVISAGGETQMPNICVTRLLGRAQHLLRLAAAGIGPENFSLVISSYDRDAGSPRHMVVLKPSAIDPDALGRPVEVPRYGPAHPAPCRPAHRRQCRALPLPPRRMGAAARFRASGVQGLGHALARLHLAAHAALRRRPASPSSPRRERGRALHRLPQRGPRHAAGGLCRGGGDRLHRGFEHHDLRSRVGAAAGGGRGARRAPLHR